MRNPKSPGAELVNTCHVGQKSLTELAHNPYMKRRAPEFGLTGAKGIDIWMNSFLYMKIRF